MNYHKLLCRQIAKYLPAALANDPVVEKFLSTISDSYTSLERDKELTERAFTIAEMEYTEVNEKLNHEVIVRRMSVEKLKEAIGKIADEEKLGDTEDLLIIARYLNQQVSKRKNAENVFNSLITNLQSAILLEDEAGRIVFVNQRFCKLFEMTEDPENLQGMDCPSVFQSQKQLFRNPQKFISGINESLANQELVSGVVLELANGSVYERDYIPIFLDKKYKGNLWSYTDVTERIRKEEEYKRISLVASANENGVLLTTPDGRISWTNDGFAKMTGFSVDEIIGRTPFELCKGPMTEKKATDKVLNSFYAGIPFSVEIIFYRKDGSWFWGRTNMQPFKDAEGKLIEFFGIIDDITEDINAEKQLRVLTENIPGILYKYDFATDGAEEFSYISPDCEKKIGLTEDQLKNFYSILHPDDVEREHITNVTARAEKRPYNFEGRFIVPGKSVIWLSFNSSFSHFNPDGSQAHTGVILNISKEKEAEMTIQLREEKYRNIIANMNLGLLEFDKESKIQFANQSFSEMSGYSAEELTGKQASDLFVQSDEQSLVNSKFGTGKKGPSDAYEIKVKNKGGEVRWWLISDAPRYNTKNELVGSVGIHLDITDQKKLEHELEEAKELAESSSKAKQIFLANMSHEIRTPMNAIVGMTNQLKKSDLNADQQFYLNIIHSAADNLLIIINDILDLSKLEAGKLNLESIGFKPSMIIKQAMQVMMHKAEEKGLALTNSLFDPKASQVLIGDPYRLNQVLLNLFSNAVKFTEKGSVDISIRVLEEKEQEQVIEFVVVDTGLGMEESFLQNLFQKFRQEDESVTRRFGGTGLGMSISKELVEFMGGEIEVQSKKGSGTRVSFMIPFKIGQESDLPVKESGTIDTKTLVGKKILITDDNEMNRLVAITILGDYGAVLSEARNGLEAIEKIKKEKFDIVLMDVQMPVMDGIEATRIIREGISKTLPVIALTALALKGDESKFLSAGMTDYLSKPFDANQLLLVITRCLGKAILLTTEKKETVNSSGLYDLSNLIKLGNGNTDFVNKMINIFIEQGPASVSEIRTGYDTGDFTKVSRIAHRFKSSVHSMGIRSIVKDLGNIEVMAEKTECREQVNGLISKVETVIAKVVNDLKLQ